MSDGYRSGVERTVRRVRDGFRQGDIPVVLSDVHASWRRFTDPSARLARRKRRTSRALTLWLVLALISVLYAVTGYFGLLGAAEGVAGALSGIVGMLIFGTLGVRSGNKLRALHRTELPARTASPPLPPIGSAAREPMRRLAECESNLDELLGRLGEHAAEPRATANDAAAALRELAARIQAIERARGNSAPGEQAELDSAVSSLVEQLEDGVDAYAGLVAAAGRAVAASSSGTTKASLTEATDHLAGLAIALRELG